MIKPVNQGIGYVKEVKKYYLEDFGFDFIAGDPQLALFEDTLASDWKDSLSGGERGIRTTLTFNDLIGRFKEYDYVIFDMGPSLGAINRAIFNMALTKLCRRAGLPHLTVHSLRHMYASILTEQGVPLIKVSALLGHSSLNTTFEYYCEVMDETEKIRGFLNNSFLPEGA